MLLLKEDKPLLPPPENSRNKYEKSLYCQHDSIELLTHQRIWLRNLQGFNWLFDRDPSLSITISFVDFLPRTPTGHLYGQFQYCSFKFSWDQQGADWSPAPHSVSGGSGQHPDRTGAEHLSKGPAHRLPLFLNPGLEFPWMPERPAPSQSIHLSIHPQLSEWRAQCPGRPRHEI